jgi:hypothetical protein
MDITLSESSALAHYGVKGMRWGVRRSSSKSTGPEDITLKTVPGKRVSAKGGGRHPASEDARTAAIYKQKARKSTVDSLSNKELQALVNRMNLEQNYSRLTADQLSPGRRLVDKFMNDKKFRNKTVDTISTVAAVTTMGKTIKKIKL